MVGQTTSTIQHIRLPAVSAASNASLQQMKMPATSGIQQVLPNKQVNDTVIQ